MKFELGTMLSRTVRNLSAPNGGIRQIVSGAISNTNNNGGILGFLKKTAGWIVGGIWHSLSSFIDWSISGLWGLFCNAVQFIWNFNWNMPDNQPEKEYEAFLHTSAALLGFTVGQGVGYLACGVLPGATLFCFNEALGVHVLNEIGEYALHQLCASTAVLIQNTFLQGGQVLFDWLYVKSRKALVPFLVDHGVINKKDAEKIGSKDAKPWSFALATQEMIHKIPNETVRVFVESAFQSATQSCVEAGYVVAGSIESYVAAQKASAKAINGSSGTLEIIFNRKAAGITGTSSNAGGTAASGGSGGTTAGGTAAAH